MGDNLPLGRGISITRAKPGGRLVTASEDDNVIVQSAAQPATLQYLTRIRTSVPTTPREEVEQMAQVHCTHKYSQVSCSCNKKPKPHTVCSKCGGHAGEKVLVNV